MQVEFNGILLFVFDEQESVLNDWPTRHQTGYYFLHFFPPFSIVL